MKTKVMVVDDSVFVHEEMKHIVEGTNFTIAACVKNGEDAIVRYEEIQPDLVLLDIIMSGIDGMDTAKIMLEKWPEAKIIFMSSLAYHETLKEAKEIGALDFIFKPAETEQVLEVLKKHASC